MSVPWHVLKNSLFSDAGVTFTGNIRFVHLHGRRKSTYPIHIWFISTYEWGLNLIGEYRNPCNIFPAYTVVGHIRSVPHEGGGGCNWVTWTMQFKCGLILAAPIHCKGYIGEQVMKWYISPNWLRWRNKLIQILDGLRGSKLSAFFSRLFL